MQNQEDEMDKPIAQWGEQFINVKQLWDLFCREDYVARFKLHNASSLPNRVLGKCEGKSVCVQVSWEDYSKAIAPFLEEAIRRFNQQMEKAQS